MIKLIGVLIIVVGFALKLDAIGIVIIAGVVTGLVSGISFPQILDILGKHVHIFNASSCYRNS
jgi:uncharacterized membrane protein